MIPTCPLCNSEDVLVIYKNISQTVEADIFRCGECEHLFSLVRKDIKTEELYSDEIYKVVENRKSIFDRIIQREYKKVLHQLDKLKVNKGALLDFGCGKGKFGSLAREDGWSVKAVETAHDRADYARTIYGLDVNSDFYSGGSIFKIQFDVLTLFHVLEHLPQPGILLNQLVLDNVSENGIIVVEVPNLKSWQARIAKEKWIHLDVPRHIHHFSPERLKKLLLDINLKPVKSTTYSFHLGVLGMVDSLLKKTGYKKNIIYELKNKRSKSLLFLITILVPLAYFMERLSALFGKGGVTRMYLVRK
jgi:2-polyprenyl-3-methyl-5-hydroxy-6-metoxy-1,4-benzoquinol methylase